MTRRSISGEFDPGPEREAELVDRNMAVLRRRVADRAIHATAVATAGTVQALVAEVGRFDRVREHDLAAAWRAARAGQARPGVVVCEHRSGLPGRSGPWDVAVLDDSGERATEVAEMKWAREKKLNEVLWDAVKIALALAGDLEDHRSLDRGILVAAAPSFERLGAELQPLLDGGAWAGGAIVTDRPNVWTTARGGNKTPPTRVPAGITLRPVASVPILAPTAADDPWELRVLEVTVTDPTSVDIAG